MPDDKDKIPDPSGLLRRIDPVHIVADGKGGRCLSTGAFRDPRVSVDVEPMLWQNGLDWRFSTKDHQGHYLVRLTAVLVRRHGQIVEHKPEITDPAHAEVVGPKSGSVVKAFRDAAEGGKKPDDIACGFGPK